ncbi:MAG: UDP-N-acetylmuramoyl-L-alanyl-D-glutamate--2,6-diaminopimelate ligase [Clostridia bacterium]|nr:UDP-N-acetylmuramoyl-L-alanyl-D-glutamate--2,6-diaminopimelate ligase [Clostridia bacterium]
MKLSELFLGAGLPYPPELGEIEIEQIVSDSRLVRRGSLFLCLRGTHTDGHEYEDEAIRRGAAVIVAERVRDACVGGAAARIVLENTRKANALLHSAFCGNPARKMKIVGVTGTGGKTSVATLICEMLRTSGVKCALIGTVCAEDAEGRVLSAATGMTTPDPEELYPLLAKMAESGAEVVVMEVSSHALALSKVDAIEFEMGVFTNLSRDHLDFHGTMEEYFLAKLRLFSLCRRACVCIDSEAGRELTTYLQQKSQPFVTCSVTDKGDYCASDGRSHGTDGVSFVMRTPMGDFALKSVLLGKFALINSLTAATVALELGCSPADVDTALNSTKGVRGRMELVVTPNTTAPSVLIDYAHTPDELEGLLLGARELRRSGGRVILVFGCGGDRDRGKRRQMGIIASRLADLCVITSDNSRGEDKNTILCEIFRGIDKEKPYLVIPDRREAILAAVLTARADDLVVLAGKGHETYEIDARGKRPFDERSIVREALLLREHKTTMDGN